MPRPITDEPVRGVVTPPWVFSLPRIEGLRLYARRLLLETPIVRLTGTGLGHVSSGLRFEARGAHSLKGVEGDFNLFLVED